MLGKETEPTAAVVLAGFTAFLSLYAPQPLLPFFARTFHASNFAVSLTVTATTVAVALAAPFVGRLADLWGRRRVIVVAAFGLAATTALAASAKGLNQVIAWRFAQGLATPGVFAVTVAYIHEHWSASRAGAATAAYVTGTIAGGFCGRVVAGVVAADVSWRASFLVLGAMGLVCAAVLWKSLPGDRGAVPDRAMDSEQHSLTAHMTNRKLLATYAVGFCVLFTQVAMFTYVTFLLAGAPYHLSTAALGSLFVVFLVGAVITPISGRWIDRYGHKAALAAAIGIGVSGAFLTLGHALAAVVAGLALCCSGVFIAQAAASSYIGVAADRDRGLAVGLYAMFYYLGGSVGGALPALFWSAGGWPACVALVVAVQIATAVIGVSFWTGRPTRLQYEGAMLP